jgi:hypothetical protein
MARNSADRHSGRRCHRPARWRVDFLIFLLLAALILPAADKSDPVLIERNQATLRQCLGLLVIQLEIVLSLVIRENVSKELAAAIATAIETCRQILEMLKYR